MTYNPIAEVEGYWEGLRGVRAVPLRSEIDPRGIERALDHTFLLERIAPGLARFRLAGKQLNSLMGMEVRGMPITACFTTDSRERMRDALSHLFEGPEIVSFDLHGETGFGRPNLSAKMILLPLQSDLGDISRALGCLAFDGKIGTAPRKFAINSVQSRKAGPFKTEQPAAPKPAPEKAGDPPNKKSPGFAEAPSSFEGRKKSEKDRSHLRVIEGDARS